MWVSHVRDQPGRSDDPTRMVLVDHGRIEPPYPKATSNRKLLGTGRIAHASSKLTLLEGRGSFEEA